MIVNLRPMPKRSLLQMILAFFFTKKQLQYRIILKQQVVELEANIGALKATISALKEELARLETAIKNKR